MPFLALDPGKYGPGTPLDTSNLEALYKGINKTNGFLMRSVDGRLPALQQPMGRMSIDSASVLNDDNVIPWGNGLWRDLSTFETHSGVVHAQKSTRSLFVGVLKFNQGWQAGHPVMPHGVPSYSKGTIITKGLVGYKTAMVAVGLEEEYLSYIKGDATKDVPATRTTYKEWMALYSAAADGSKLGLFIGNDSGFPIVSIIPVAQQAAPVLANATFAGFAVVFERENEAVFFDINL